MGDLRRRVCGLAVLANEKGNPSEELLLGPGMADAWDRFLSGFDKPTTSPEPEDEPDIFEEIDALYWARRERHDAKWQPSKAELARLVADRRKRRVGPLEP
jgi:hypothetical protein